LGERIAQDGRSLNAIEKAAGISGNGLGKVLRGERGSIASLTPLYIKRLAPVLGISEATLLERAGHMTHATPAPSAEDVIGADADLVPEDKNLLIAMYRRMKKS
jgi:transcriptional regulator with XRE-family HTH domain